jgi:ATP-dependent DNA helicase RecG
MKENQTFERKSIKINPKDLSVPVVAFANADGGILAIGITDDGRIEGIKGYENKVNEILRVGYDFCKPTIRINFKKLDCIDMNSKKNQILCLEIEQSQQVHTNQKDEVFYRVGDKSKKLNFEERLQLVYDKGDIFFEDTVVKTAKIDDIDINKVKEYTSLIEYDKTPEAFLFSGRNFVHQNNDKNEITVAAILLFGKNPQKFFPRATVRFIKYNGTEEKFGTNMNVIKDLSFTGTILDILRKTLEFVDTQIKEYTKLGKDGKFQTIPEYPEFVWKELIINALCHRDYSIKGTDIQIKMFDNRFVVESPGKLPGLVRLDNIRKIHFSRNPKIAEFLKNYTYVKEFGEGVDRMYTLLEEEGLPEPKYETIAFMLKVTVWNRIGKDEPINEPINEPIKLTKAEKTILLLLEKDPELSKPKISKMIELSESSVKRIFNELQKKGIIKHFGPNKTGYWKIMKKQNNSRRIR